MSNVSSKQVTQKPNTLVNPNNFLPPHVIDLEYLGLDTPADSALAAIGVSGDSDTIGGGVDFSDIYIVSQTLRADPSGKWVVDVVLGVPDKKGVTEWEVRLTKV